MNEKDIHTSPTSTGSRRNKIILDNFVDLAEIVALHNFYELTNTKEEPRKEKGTYSKSGQNQIYSKSGYKKAILVSKAPKKAILTSKPIRKIIKGFKFTPKKDKMYGRMIHYTNPKNSFIRAQKQKSRKGK